MKKEKSKKNVCQKYPTIAKRSFLLLLILILGGVWLPAATSAAQESVAERNLRLCEEAIDALGNAIEAYSISDTSEGKEISQKVSVAIISYRKEILDMQGDPLFSDTSFESRIALAKAKGLAAGKATWIFRSRIYEYPSLSHDEKLLAEFDRISTEISSSLYTATTEASVPKYISSINQTAFTQLIKSEGRAGDSLAVNAIIEGSIEEINKL